MRGYLTFIKWCSVFKEEDPETICTNFTILLQDAMAVFIPNKTITRKPGDKAWFNEQCRKAATKKQRLYNKMRTSNDPARAAFNQAEKRAKRQYNNKLKKDLSDNSLRNGGA